MKYENIQDYSDERFRRITGVKRETFAKMLEILRPAKAALTAMGGPKPKLTLENRLLAALEYLREYRTYAHVAASYGISESSTYRIIKWVENTLIVSKAENSLSSLLEKDVFNFTNPRYEYNCPSGAAGEVKRQRNGGPPGQNAKRSRGC